MKAQRKKTAMEKQQTAAKAKKARKEKRKAAAGTLVRVVNVPLCANNVYPNRVARMQVPLPSIFATYYLTSCFLTDASWKRLRIRL